jgi:nucleotide-binding universal stress UspA family protein
MRPKKVLVPVDGGTADEEAVGLSCRLAKKSGGKVYVTYVIQVDRTLPLDAEVKAEIERGEQVLDTAERIAEDQDYNVETDLLQAREIGPAIVDEAIERGVVLKNAPCWVLICREPIPEEES